jgi:hypothetical protein
MEHGIQAVTLAGVQKGATERVAAAKRLLGRWAATTTTVLGFASVLGLTLKPGELEGLSTNARDAVISDATLALGLAIMGIVIAALAAAFFGADAPAPTGGAKTKMLSGEELTLEEFGEATNSMNSKAQTTVTRIYVALAVSVGLVLVSVIFAGKAIDTSLTGQREPLTEKDFVMSATNDLGTPASSYCGTVRLEQDGEIRFIPYRTGERVEEFGTPVAAIKDLTETESCRINH